MSHKQECINYNEFHLEIDGLAAKRDKCQLLLYALLSHFAAKTSKFSSEKSESPVIIFV